MPKKMAHLVVGGIVDHGIMINIFMYIYTFIINQENN